METKMVIGQKAPAQEFPPKEDVIKSLPPPIQRYCSYALKNSSCPAHKVKIVQSGSVRDAERKRWLPFKAVQYFNGSKPAFIWIANIRIRPLVWLAVRDLYCNRKGGITRRLFSSIPLSNTAGRELAVSALSRYLAEAVWFPATLIYADFINWEPVNDYCAQATIKDGKNRAKVLFFVDQQGQITEVFCSERYREKGGIFYKQKWKGFFKQYKQWDHINIPSVIEAEWESDDGPFQYVKIKVEGIEVS